MNYWQRLRFRLACNGAICTARSWQDKEAESFFKNLKEIGSMPKPECGLNEKDTNLYPKDISGGESSSNGSGDEFCNQLDESSSRSTEEQKPDSKKGAVKP
jgi:hypothetical protein